MLIAVTGATGFVGRYIVNYLLKQGHSCRCWMRPTSDIGGFVRDGRERLHFIPGQLNDLRSAHALLEGVDAVVHAAVAWPRPGAKPDSELLVRFAEANITGSLRLMAAARKLGVPRFVFMSTAAVLDLQSPQGVDEASYICPTNHYTAHKAAIEKFVHSYGLGERWDICALRPAGVYGLTRPLNRSRWYQLVSNVLDAVPIRTSAGAYAVHAIDVAKAVHLLLQAPGIAGQCYDCVDAYVPHELVARIAQKHCTSASEIASLNKGPTGHIESSKLRNLGLNFGGTALLERTIRQMIELIPTRDAAVPSPYLSGDSSTTTPAIGSSDPSVN